ncbi:long-chain acyl-CoA synthetase [Cytobacillus firmus]|uniref:Long-chain acyl-CoA synthetase n=2 Tax=Cytobacillus TaxID=2675230 RepID=A0A366K262_CYTFI|nr:MULTISPECIES: fatty acid--CoA ligase family protein [Cytobacillus]RBP95846.1 long-chain acyl-CoA synthetase [Cytobacillus firmus]TDX44759.1 long-chain acyl-CoA synthetase [Cytobacillus oceanisediminis]
MNLVHSLIETAKSHGDRTAFIYEEKETTYQQFLDAVIKFASGLHKVGVKQGDHVALLVGNSPEFIIGLHGALRAGATVIPINPIYTPDEITYIIKNGDVKTVIALDTLLPVMEQVMNHVPALEQIIVCAAAPGGAAVKNNKIKTFTEVLMSGDPELPLPIIHKDQTAVILYTSGTTGKPKGAMLTHYNLYSNARDLLSFLEISKNDHIIAVLPMFHVFCLTVAINVPIICGATILIVPKFIPSEVFRISRNYKATVFAGVPTMYNFLLHYPEADPSDLQSLRLCVSGGASMPLTLLENFEKKYNVQISEGYGLSEASPVTCFNPLDRPRKPGSVGTSIINVENKVVNELGEAIPAGEVGELIVRGPNVMKGYYKMPEETASAIQDGWLHTGDLAKMDDDGYFYIVDRKKDLVIVGGYNVYPREVEEVLYSHSSVVEAAVIGVPDEDYGEALKAYVVRKDPSLTEEELTAFCRGHLAKYKVPSGIEFLDELPKNTTGKILKRALRQTLLSKDIQQT